jgi:cell division control protein 45
MLYSLASELGREDNDLLWLALVGMSSTELYGRSKTANSETRQNPWNLSRGDQIRDILRDEVRRLNPIPASEIARERDMGESGGVIPTHARSPTDNSIRLSPEPKFLLIRHWSLYESMLHSPYLSSRLHIWSDAGRRRLHKLLAKMGVSLAEAAKGYTHMDMELKRGLRERLLKFAPMYGLDGLVPTADSHRHGHEGWGFVRSWGWQACLSAVDVAVITSAILQVGTDSFVETISPATPHTDFRLKVYSNYNPHAQTLPTPPNSHSGDSSPSTTSHAEQDGAISDPDWTTHRFFAAYDALSPSSSALQLLLSHVPTAQHVHRAILRTGSALISKHQIRHLRAFRMGVVREGPDVRLFIHPGALVKLASWISEAISVLEAEKGAKQSADQGALVLAALDDRRGVYVVVGLGGSSHGGRIRSRAEQKAHADKKAAREAKREEKKAAKAASRAARKLLRKERNEANGIFVDSDDEDEEASDAESLSSASDSSDDESDSDDAEDEREKRKTRGYGTNKFGSAFQEVVEETGARVRIDSFEHEVVEVKKEDLSGFLEALSFKGVVG